MTDTPRGETAEFRLERDLAPFTIGMDEDKRTRRSGRQDLADHAPERRDPDAASDEQERPISRLAPESARTALDADLLAHVRFPTRVVISPWVLIANSSVSAESDDADAIEKAPRRHASRHDPEHEDRPLPRLERERLQPIGRRRRNRYDPRREGSLATTRNGRGLRMEAGRTWIKKIGAEQLVGLEFNDILLAPKAG